MRVLVIGAAGMIGRKLCAALARDGALGGRPIESAHFVDLVAPAPLPAPFPAQCEALDLCAEGASERLIAERPDVVFLLAAVVSGEAERDFDKGYAINLDATRRLFEAIRHEREASGGAYVPRLVFASSIAVFGVPFPETIGDDFHLTPLTSYGTQKAVCELLLADYSRRGIFEGVGLRLPTICVRPGKPNTAVSGFFSSIIREPLEGREAILPAPDTVRHWFASPRAAVGFFLHAAVLDVKRLAGRPNLTLPGVSATVAEQIEALRRSAGDGAVRLIRHEPDAKVREMIAGWPTRFDARRATALGFAAEADFDEIIRVYLEDDHVAAVA
ncbi:MAG: SDR family oxidoreductase [Bradyrhizobium sp.]|nr:MAG: SDR family oxidoreductase [Bradyrhizobium sp.]